MENYSKSIKVAMGYMHVLTKYMTIKVLLTVIALTFISQIGFGQELQEGEYWDSLGEGRQSVWEYSFFSKEDVIKGSRKLSLIKQSASKDEWNGGYSSNHDGLGEELLFWNSENGFVKYYFYHTLKRLSFGNTKSNEDSIVLIYEKLPRPSKTRSTISSVLVKVKFGDQHCLILESDLIHFLEDVAGVFPRQAPPYSYSLWTKIDDFKKEIFGEPQVPARYKHLLR